MNFLLPIVGGGEFLVTNCGGGGRGRVNRVNEKISLPIFFSGTFRFSWSFDLSKELSKNNFLFESFICVEKLSIVDCKVIKDRFIFLRKNFQYLFHLCSRLCRKLAMLKNRLLRYFCYRKSIRRRRLTLELFIFTSIFNFRRKMGNYLYKLKEASSKLISYSRFCIYNFLSLSNTTKTFPLICA